MAVTTSWSPNQAAISQVRQYTFSAPNSAGNTYVGTTNGKSVTYSSVSGDTAATAATALFNLLNASASATGNLPELTEVQFSDDGAGVLTATAKTPGVPFAGVTVNGVANQGLVLSTGNGLANGITTVETRASSSPSDVLDPQNWLRSDLSTTPPNRTRAIPVSGDDVVVANSAVPLLWNLDRLSDVQFATYTRDQSFTASIGLPDQNPAGHAEWRATKFKFLGPQGSVPSGGLQMVLGMGAGSGPTLERYDLQSSQYTLHAMAAGQPSGEFGVTILGQHTANVVNVLGGVRVGVARSPGEKATLSSSQVGPGSTLGVGEVTWTAGSTLTVNGGSVSLASAPATLALTSGAQAVVEETDLTWATVTAKLGCTLNWRAGGTITSLDLANNSFLVKGDARGLTITNSAMDGDCQVVDALNAVTFTNATSVRGRVVSGPFVFTGTRTVKVT